MKKSGLMLLQVMTEISSGQFKTRNVFYFPAAMQILGVRAGRRIRLAWKENSVSQNSKKVFSEDKPKDGHYRFGILLRLGDFKRQRGEEERGRKFLVKGIAGARVWTWEASGEGRYCSFGHGNRVHILNTSNSGKSQNSEARLVSRVNLYLNVIAFL